MAAEAATEGATRRTTGSESTLVSLSRIGTLIASERNPQQVIQRVIDEATGLVGAEFGAFFYNVENVEGESYMLYALAGAPHEAFADFPMPRNTAIFAPTFSGDGIVRLDDVTQDARYGKSLPYAGLPPGHLPVRSYLAVPVRSTDAKVLGGLFFGHSTPGVFDETAEQVVAALSPIAGVALSNARLFSELSARQIELRQSEARHRLVSEATQQGVWFWEVGSNRVEWNERLYTLMGFSEADWGGSFEDWFGRLHPEDQPRLAEALRAHLEERVPYRIETFRLRHADGEYRWCTTTGQAEWDEHGKPLWMSGSFSDITEQTRARDFQKLLVEASGIFSASIDYEVTLSNVARATVPRFADWTAVDLLEGTDLRRLAVCHSDPAKVALAHDLHRRYPPDLNAPHGIARVLRTREIEHIPEVTDELLVQVARDAEHLELARALGLRSAIVTPILVQGHVIGALTFVSSDSHRRYRTADVEFAAELARRAAIAIENAQLYRKVQHLAATLEERVEERTAALTEANRELEAFSYTVSHDLRAPVRHISGFTDLLRTQLGDAVEDDRTRRYLDTIKSAALRMGSLIDALLSFSRLGQVDLQKRAVALHAVVRDVLREVEPDVAARSIHWTVEPLPEVWADATMLRLVISNLIQNAIKYTRKQRAAHIAIGARLDDGEIVVWVSDDGVGFNMEYANKLFGVFQRLHADAEFEGTGIGLATVRRVIQRHGGRSWAEAAEGRGATFYFSLPTEDTKHE